MREVTLPRDHEGREISLDTEVLFDANDRKVRVTSYRYRHDVFGHSSVWKVFSPDARGEDGLLPTSGLYLTPRDSWERLEEDLGKIANHQPEVVCSYFDRGIKDCDGCKLENCEHACSHAFLEDVIARIHKLRGEQDA